jgi:hypothetical protein
MAVVDWQMWSNERLTRVLLVANGMLTRGPIRGRHVSLVVWLKLCHWQESTPRPPGRGNDLARSCQPAHHHALFNIYMVSFVFQFEYGYGLGRDRAGA